jgi:hypothetical protein
MRPRTRREAFWERAIGLLEIIGGLLGIYFYVKIPLSWLPILRDGGQVRFTLQGADLALLAIGSAYFLLCIYAGIRLYRDQRGGRLLSIIMLALQVPVLAGASGIWKIHVGLSMIIFWTVPSNMDVTLGYGNAFDLALGSEQPLYIGINIFPLLLAIQLRRLKKLQISQSAKAAAADGASG